jgi:hypothetical protein
MVPSSTPSLNTLNMLQQFLVCIYARDAVAVLVAATARLLLHCHSQVCPHSLARCRRCRHWACWPGCVRAPQGTTQGCLREVPSVTLFQAVLHTKMDTATAVPGQRTMDNKQTHNLKFWASRPSCTASLHAAVIHIYMQCSKEI